MDSEYLQSSRRRGDEPLPRGTTLLNFWQWMGSELLTNTLRGIFAEYLVGLAVDAKSITPADGVREEWGTYDLEANTGTKIEVKSSAYDQIWPQRRPSSPRFAIAPAAGWDDETDEVIPEKRRWADVYVFCLLKKHESGSPNPLDIEQWTFFIVPTSTLDEKVGNQKTIGLGSLKKLLPETVGFEGVAGAVERAAGRSI